MATETQIPKTSKESFFYGLKIGAKASAATAAVGAVVASVVCGGKAAWGEAAHVRTPDEVEEAGRKEAAAEYMRRDGAGRLISRYIYPIYVTAGGTEGGKRVGGQITRLWFGDNQDYALGENCLWGSVWDGVNGGASLEPNADGTFSIFPNNPLASKLNFRAVDQGFLPNDDKTTEILAFYGCNTTDGTVFGKA